MAVPAPTGTFRVDRPDGSTVTVAGNAEILPSRRQTETGTDPRALGMAAPYSMQLDPGAWPVTEQCTVTDVESGRRYLVRTAAYLAGRTGRLAHVAVVAELQTTDRTAVTVDPVTGTVIGPAVPQESPIGSGA